MRIAVTGRLPPLAVAVNCTGELTVAPDAGDETLTVCAKPIVENATKPIKSLTIFFKLKLLFFGFVFNRSQAKDASTLVISGEFLDQRWKGPNTRASLKP